MENYIENTDDIEPVKYLIAKFIFNRKPEDIREQIAALQAQLEKVEGV